MVRLQAGIAELLHNGTWVEAITDEVARESAMFQRWEGDVTQIVRVRGINGQTMSGGQVAVFMDCNGRMWRQRGQHVVDVRINTRMIVKVTVHPTHVLIHNEDHSVHMQHPPSTVLIAKLGGVAVVKVGHVAYFDAIVTSGVVELGEKITTEQKW